MSIITVKIKNPLKRAETTKEVRRVVNLTPLRLEDLGENKYRLTDFPPHGQKPTEISIREYPWLAAQFEKIEGISIIK